MLSVTDAAIVTVARRHGSAFVATFDVEFHSLHLCATVPNARIMEIDVDDVPWKDELVDAPPVIERGEVLLPTRPGWGAELVEAVARQHVWEPGRLPGYSAATLMYGR